MKPNERDELLIRLDERTNNIWRAIETLQEHQVEQNGLLRQSVSNTTWRKVHTWVIGLLIAAISALYSKMQGMW